MDQGLTKMSRYQNKELRETVIELWNNNESSKAIAKNEKVKSLWGGNIDANAIGCYVAELRRSHKANLNYRGSQWQRKRHKTRRSRSKKPDTVMIGTTKPKNTVTSTVTNDVLLKVGATLKNEDPIKYLIKTLIEAVNNDFRNFNV